MNDEVLVELLPVVNDPSTYNALVNYAQSRIDTLNKELENLESGTLIYRVQGQIREMRKLMSLREDVRKKAETRNGR